MQHTFSGSSHVALEYVQLKPNGKDVAIYGEIPHMRASQPRHCPILHAPHSVRAESQAVGIKSGEAFLFPLSGVSTPTGPKVMCERTLKAPSWMILIKECWHLTPWLGAS